MDGNAKYGVAYLAEVLEASQSEIERLMFDEFNQQDKQLAMISEGMELLDEVLAHMDAINYEMENTLQLAEIAGNTQLLEDIKSLFFAAEQKLAMLSNLAALMQKLHQGQEFSLGCVHCIEEEISNQMERVEKLCSAWEKAD